jgi:dolichol-phosphate mannosyltransferase
MLNVPANSTLVTVIPTKNEGKNIRGIAEELNELLQPKSIFVMDDSSTDDTELQCELMRSSGIPITYVKRTQNFGYGAATIDGMLKFLSVDADWLLTSDGDGSHRAVDALTIYQSRIPGITIGSRWTGGGKTIGWPLYRRVMSRCANSLATRVLNLKIRDKTNGLRIYDRNTVKTLLDHSLPVGYDFLLATLFLAKRLNIPMQEIPISFIQRAQGSSNLGIKQIFEWVNELRTLKREWASDAKN